MTPKILTATLSTLVASSLFFSARADITSGLVGYWKLDEGSGATTADASGNGNNGTLTQFADASLASAWTTNGWLNNAVLFGQNGETNNYVSVADSATLDSIVTTKKFTLSAWVRLSTTSGQGAILCKGIGGGQESWCMDISSSKFRVFMRNSSGSSANLSSTINPSANTWYHVVATYDSATTPHMFLYINSVSNNNGGGTLTSVYANTHVVSIGNREANATSGYNLPFKGTIDEVRVYNRALTPSDVFQVYTNGAPVPLITTQPRNVNCYSNDTAVFSVGVNAKGLTPVTYQWQFNGVGVAGATANTLRVPNVTSANAGAYTVVVSNYAGAVISAPATLSVRDLPAVDTTSGLVGWWKLDEANGSSTAADASGNGNAGALVNFSDTTFTSQWGDGIIGGGLAFNGDGTGSNVVALPGLGMPGPAALDFSASPVFTLAAWVNASLVQTNPAAIIAKGTGSGGEQYCIDISGGNYRFFVRDTNAASTAMSSLGAINGAWQHVAAVFNATNGLMSFYLNGVLTGSAVAPRSLLATNHEVSLGNRQSGTADYNYPFTGALDDVRVYNRDLTAADVYALYGAAAYPIIIGQTPANATNAFTLFAGASPTFKVTVTGAVPLVYQWYTNGVADAGGTNANYQFANLPLGPMTAYCIITNNLGTATSLVWTASVVAPPTASYPQTVLQDGPVGYWRLNETPDNGTGNNGTRAEDYRGGNFGFYANTVLGQDGYSRALSNQFGYYPATEPDETSAQFGFFNGGVSNLVTGIQGVDFSTPANHSGSFSIEAWAKGEVSQYYNAGIVAKGAWGAEQFTLDTGGTSYSYRFTMRDAGKAALYVGANTNLPDGNWHHLVGVLDQPHSNACLYVDGVKVASVACSPSNGVLSTTVPMSIGCRLGSGTVGYNQQFMGNINDVAVYNYALSASQVTNHYLAAGLPPRITQNPVAFTNVDEGTTLVVAAQGGGGTQPVTVQWYDVTYGLPGTPVVGQTNTTLVLNNISAAAYNGHALALRLSNSFGSPYSSSVTITVQSGAPLVTVTPAAVTLYSNQSVVFKANATGSEPFTYQWSNNGSAVPGATGATYTGVAGVGAATLSCTVTGPKGSGSASATLTGVAYPAGSYARGILADQPLAYWRLDETAGATFANDYAGGHNAFYYSAVNGLPGFSSANPDAATGFGMNGVANYSLALEQDNSSSGLPTIDFSKLGSNAQFSVEAWVKAPVGQPNGASIVTKGYGNGGEQFNLDLYGNSFRFFMRDAAAATHGPTSTFHVDGGWHHVVGVCDMSNGVVNLYIDGALQAFTTNLPGLGVLAPLPAGTPVLTGIGARMSGAVDSGYSFQLTNTVVDEVALYGYALSSNQVAAHYTAAALRPQIVQDLQTQMYATVGFPLSFSVLASSGTPLGYQWQRNGLNLVDGGAISGSQSNVLSLGLASYSDSGSTFQVVVTNQNGSVTSTRATLTVLSQLGFNGYGNGWAIQGSPFTVPTYVSPNVLRLIDGGKSEASSSFFSSPVYIGGFLASFTYQDVGGGGADGMAFVVQNDPRGAAALGNGGNGLGYGGILQSAALEFNIYASSTPGYAFRTNGATGKPYTSALPVDLASGDPINVTVLYLDGLLTLSLTDAVAQTSFTVTTNIDIPMAVGADTAYVGFTGGDGSTASTQIVSNFAFVSLPTLAIQATSDNHVVISWPAATGGQTLQQSPSLAPASWSTVSTPATTVGGFNQVTLPASNGATFYRLISGQ